MFWMRSSQVFRASGLQCQSRNSSGIDPNIKIKNPKIPLLKKRLFVTEKQSKWLCCSMTSTGRRVPLATILGQDPTSGRPSSGAATTWNPSPPRKIIASGQARLINLWLSSFCLTVFEEYLFWYGTKNTVTCSTFFSSLPPPSPWLVYLL